MREPHAITDYGEATTNPTKVTLRSERTAGINGKGDWERPIFDRDAYDEAMDRMFPRIKPRPGKRKYRWNGKTWEEYYSRDY